MNKYKATARIEAQHRAGERAARFNAIENMDDQKFLEALKALHHEFMVYVITTMRNGRCPNHLFKSIARSIAENKDYIFLCDRIYIPICFQERLMKLLNAHQQELNQFTDVEKEQQKSEETEVPAEASKEAGQD